MRVKKSQFYGPPPTSMGTREISVEGVRVSVVRKAIRHLRLGVYPPHGRVRVTAPLSVSDDAVHLAIVRKLGWIRRHQARFAAQPRPSAREMVSGESHDFLGRPFRLQVVEHDGPAEVAHLQSTIELRVRRSMNTGQRERVLRHWYRQQLTALIPPLLEEWQRKLGVEIGEWRIKRMKTRWGTCNVRARRIWLNLELAKKSLHCLEYVVVHELAHLLERRHNARFVAIMDQHLPEWRARRQELNAAPLGHDAWTD